MKDPVSKYTRTYVLSTITDMYGGGLGREGVTVEIGGIVVWVVAVDVEVGD